MRINKSGTFEEICNGIDLLLSMNIKVNVRVNVDMENLSSLGMLENLFKEKGWDRNTNIYPYLSPVFDHSGCNHDQPAIKEMDILKKVNDLSVNYFSKDNVFKTLLGTIYGYMNHFMDMEKKEPKLWKMLNCEAVSEINYIFAPDKHIYTCLELAGDKPYAIGTYDSELHLDEEKTKQWFERDVFRIPKCRECRIAFICGGGCPVAALKINNDIDRPVCNDAEENIHAYLDIIKDQILSKCC